MICNQLEKQKKTFNGDFCFENKNAKLIGSTRGNFRYLKQLMSQKFLEDFIP